MEKSLKMRAKEIDLDKLLKLDEKRRELQTQVENIQAKKNRASKEVPHKEGTEKQAILAELKVMSEEQSLLEEKLTPAAKELKELLLQIPNVLDERVPAGESDKDNKEMYTWGEIPKFNFTPKDHVTLGRDLDIIDIERGVKVGGTRSYILKGDGARLEQAIIKYAQDFITRKGYKLLIVPVLINPEVLVGAGFFPGGEEDTYHLTKDEKYLVGTSEASICGMHMKEILDGADLPLRYAGVSSCFRRESGTYGKDTRGLYRMHQFNKVEQMIIAGNSVEESNKLHEELQKNAEEFVQTLRLPYRMVAACAGDLSNKTAYMTDLEVWMPSRGAYGETHSCSIIYDYQARRLNMKYRDKQNKMHYCHTLNNTVIATPRILIPILETYQNEDGSITIPDILRPYMDNQERIEK